MPEKEYSNKGVDFVANLINRRALMSFLEWTG
jgi:hypothetical protein